MRILHTMLRVGNLERSVAFYRDVLGMNEYRRQDYPEGRFTLVFMGYQPENESTVLELTFNWDTQCYDLGVGFEEESGCGIVPVGAESSDDG